MDAFGIGAPKSATTWLARCIDEHPEIAVSDPKEPDFFRPVVTADRWEPEPNPAFLENWDWYTRCWESVPRDTVRVDFSVFLMRYVPEAPRAIREAFPETKFIVMLRDPVDRAYSEWWHRRRPRYPEDPVPDSFEAALEEDWFAQASRYGELLEVWFDIFPEDRFHVMTFLDLDEDPREVIRSTYAFLGVDDGFEPPSLEERLNVSVQRLGLWRVASNLAEAFRDAGLGDAVDLFKRFEVEGLIKEADRTEFDYPPLDEDVEARVRERYADDIERLEELLGRDLPPWKP